MRALKAELGQRHGNQLRTGKAEDSHLMRIAGYAAAYNGFHHVSLLARFHLTVVTQTSGPDVPELPSTTPKAERKTL